jgi:quinol monooxygenase YgiN
MLDE